MAAVNQSFRLAAKMVLSSHGGLNLAKESSALPTRMDTALLLDWAAACTDLCLSNDACKLPGLQSFAGQASLTELRISCEDMLAVAKADAVLAVAQQLEVLDCRGWYNPSSLPNRSLTELHVDLSSWVYNSGQTQAPGEHLPALLYRLAHLQGLQNLYLGLGNCFVLPQPERPLKLTYLDISFDLQHDLQLGARLDLSWLKAQPAEQLSLYVSIYTGSTAAHSSLAERLQQLDVHELTLRYYCAVPADAQEQWTQVVVQEECTIVLCEPEMCLAATPQCPVRVLRHGRNGVMSVDWEAALCSCEGMVSLEPKHGHAFIIVGQTNKLPDLEEPWQLTVLQPDLVAGLPDSKSHCYSDGSLSYQNQAANDIGWG